MEDPQFILFLCGSKSTYTEEVVDKDCAGYSGTTRQINAFVLLVQQQPIQQMHWESTCQISGCIKLEPSSAKTSPESKSPLFGAR